MATFNGERYIIAQLTSILSQLSNDDEVVVSDDGSTDRTIELIDQLSDSRVRWAGQGGNLGVVKNFQRALLFAKGELIFLADQDDVWLPDRVEIMKVALIDNLLVVTDCQVVDAQLKVLDASFFKARGSGAGVWHNFFRNSYLGCCMAFHRDLLKYALPFPKNVPMHDMWLGMLAELYGKVDFVPKTLTLYRRHSSNSSPTAGKSPNGVCRKLTLRLKLASSLAVRVTKIMICNYGKNFSHNGLF